MEEDTSIIPMVEKDAATIPMSLCNDHGGEDKYYDIHCEGSKITSHPQSNRARTVQIWIQTFLNWAPTTQNQAISTLVEAVYKRGDSHGLEALRDSMYKYLYIDFLSQLPGELGLLILSNLGASLDMVWKRRAEIDFEDTPFDSKEDTAAYITKQLGKPVQSWSWKKTYALFHVCDQSWHDPSLATFPHYRLTGHSNVITCLVQTGDGRVISGSSDHLLRMWCLETQKLLKTLRGHRDGVWCADARNDLAVSGSCDRDVRIWDLAKGRCLHVLHGHASTVRCVALVDNHVISGSRDRTLRIWDVTTGECFHRLTGHTDSIRCLAWYGSYVASGSYDASIKIWIRPTFQIANTLLGHTNRVYSMEMSSRYLVSGSLDATICVWNVEAGERLHVLYGHTQLTIMMALSAHTLVSANADRTLRVWDLRTGQCLSVLGNHQGCICHVILKKNVIISCAKDGTIRVWNRHTGEELYVLVDMFERGRQENNLPEDAVRESGRCTIWRMVATKTQIVAAVGWHDENNNVRSSFLSVFDTLPFAMDRLT